MKRYLNGDFKNSDDEFYANDEKDEDEDKDDDDDGAEPSKRARRQ